MVTGQNTRQSTYTFFPFSNMPFTFSMAFLAASKVSKCTKPYPLDPFMSMAI